ncbi:MAG: AmmeMemoRadiSam system protein B [Candidatus Omnitrophica bacterium]|nr:AmmeMemoRadiSam system protein B [Candidatus Omnitrophota bacterium]
MLLKKLLCLFTVILFSGAVYSADYKESEFSGSWYPEDTNLLNDLIQNLLDNSRPKIVPAEPLGIIVPHAGYIYSASVAAEGFKAVGNVNPDTIILLGPSHRYLFKGIAVFSGEGFINPLGTIITDKDSLDKLRLPFVNFESKYFDNEHSIEVQLPFVKKLFPESKIVAVLFSDTNYSQLQQFAEKLYDISKEKKILIIVSSDLSHYHSLDEAKKIDLSTINLIISNKSEDLWKTRGFGKGRACGVSAIVAFLEYLSHYDLKLSALSYLTSAARTLDESKVVGYASLIGYKNKDDKKEAKMEEYSLKIEEKTQLLKIARDTLTQYFAEGPVEKKSNSFSNLNEKRGVFVTLKKNRRLRGCIGRIVADKPLYQLVSDVTIDSAVNDPRFSPVEKDELNEIEIEISVLTPFVQVRDLNEIVVGEHGLIIKKGFDSGLLLPQVASEYGWDRETFLEQTCLKAGLNQQDYKDKSTKIYRFSAIVFNEEELRK